MRKVILIIAVLLIVLFVYDAQKSKQIVKIPDEAIRFRILANSNSPRDQKIKEDVKNKMQKELYNLLKNTNSISDARMLINNNMNNFVSILDNEMQDKEYSYTIDYGMHLFPEKEYKNVHYNEGYYESLLVTLGKGEGDNWWCVLFPPFCMLEAEETTTKDVEYHFFIKDIIENIFK